MSDSRDSSPTLPTNPDQERLYLLRDQARALILATIDEDGFPSLSTLPFVWYEQAFWVLMSDLSPHTKQVRHHPVVELMLIEDEAKTHNIYNRARVTWRADVMRVERGDSRSSEVFQGLRSRHGKIVDVLLQLPDFHLHRMVPGAGRLVNGFGRAFKIDGFDLLTHLRGS
ncbi:HugZ family protein [Halothiobacillus sp. DCM-1]|uniref:HugZ family pyridoxamine 5'-phosphate oxidase n=1 Tax=Halothiobacillus sp. DCM-1 TaxID=3112558 RepID=UPI003243919A